MSVGLADIFASVRLNLETGKFETDALKSATLVSGKMGGILKKAVGGALGAGAGLAFASMTRGALELDTAMSKLTADTGMTAEEAKAASKAMAALFRDNLQSFDEIGAAMAAVRNDLGLVGDAANEATAKFLKYATATGQVASDAVVAFDDVLDAWNLTADNAAGLMDKLIVSHQKYGGSITDSQAALADMAPAMQAMNMTVDDGIALLNLFALSGIDSAKATTMLRSAVKKLKPGQDINDLIAQVGAIEDPVLRGQKAMELFGSKTGIAMAQAIRPGMKSLADLTASLGDTAGATEDAAATIEDTFDNRVTLALKQLNGVLADVGTGMGDLLMVAALLGPGLTRSLAAAIGGIAGLLAPQLAAQWTALGASGAVKAAASAAGLTSGMAYVQGFLKVLPMIGIALAGKDTLGRDSPQAQEMWRKLAFKHGVAYGDGLAEGVVQADMNEIGEKAGRDVGQGWTTAIKGQFAVGIPAAFGLVTDAAKGAAEKFGFSVRRVSDAARSTGRIIRTSFATTAAYLLGEFDKDYSRAMGIVEARSRLHNAKTKQDKAEAYRDLAELGVLSKKDYGRWIATMEDLAKGLHGKAKTAAEEAIAHIKALRAEANKPIKVTVTTTYKGEGGLKDDNHAAGGPIYRPSWVGERGPEIYVPPAAGRILSHADSMAAVSGRSAAGDSTTTINNNVAITGLVRARDPLEIATQLRRFASLGVLTPQRVPG